MSHYLVTGAAGFIASRVSGMLLDAGHGVTGVDNLNDAYDVRMKEHRLQRLLGRPGFEFHRLDISARGPFAEGGGAFGRRYDGVINLAARAGVRQSVENPWVYMDTNLTGTLNLLEMCRREGIPKLILASSSSVYGDNAPLPTPETSDSDHPLQSYAASKKAAEVLCHAYHHLYGIDVTVVRFFTVYGPAGRPDMSVFRFARWIREGQPVHLNGDGEQRRGFTFVDDIARGAILALKPVGYEVINLGGHEYVRMLELIGLLEELIGKRAEITYHPPHPADLRANWANVEKAGRLLGWKPEVSLRQGLQQVVDWYEAERGWAGQLKLD